MELTESSHPPRLNFVGWGIWLALFLTVPLDPPTLSGLLASIELTLAVLFDVLELSSGQQPSTEKEVRRGAKAAHTSSVHGIHECCGNVQTRFGGPAPACWGCELRRVLNARPCPANAHCIAFKRVRLLSSM